MFLEKLRKEKGMTQKELAEKLNTDQSNISRYENDEREPNLEMLKKMSSVLECTVDELIGNTPS